MVELVSEELSSMEMAFPNRPLHPRDRVSEELSSMEIILLF